jgi:hypothetical protein
VRRSPFWSVRTRLASEEHSGVDGFIAGRDLPAQARALDYRFRSREEDNAGWVFPAVVDRLVQQMIPQVMHPIGAGSAYHSNNLNAAAAVAHPAPAPAAGVHLIR